MKFTVRTRINCSVERFWELYASDANTRTGALASGAVAVDIVERNGEFPQAFSRTIRMEHPVDAPGPVRKLLGETQTITDAGVYDPDARTWSYSVTPATLASKISIAGVIRAADNGDGTVDKVNELDVSVKIFGVGALVEKSIEAQTRKSEEAYAKALNELV
mgnify:CR=1 FL=1